MADQQGTEGPRAVSRHARDRIGAEAPQNVTVEPPTAATNEAALKILRDEGVDAYQAYLRDKGLD